MSLLIPQNGPSEYAFPKRVKGDFGKEKRSFTETPDRKPSDFVLTPTPSSDT